MIYLKKVKSKQTLDKRVQSLAHLTPLHSGTHETLHHSTTYSSIFHAKIPQKVCTTLKSAYVNRWQVLRHNPHYENKLRLIF